MLSLPDNSLAGLHQRASRILSNIEDHLSDCGIDIILKVAGILTVKGGTGAIVEYLYV